MEKIIGLIDAPFTPFYANGDVNLEPIEAYAKMLQKNGLKGVFINGSSGEGYMLTTEERMLLAERWVAVAPKDFKIIVHVGSCCLRESRRLAEHAQKLGVWGIGSMAPPFPHIGRIEELVKYCEEIASAAPELPFYYYHIPAFNGAYLPMLDLLNREVIHLLAKTSIALDRAGSILRGVLGQLFHHRGSLCNLLTNGLDRPGDCCRMAVDTQRQRVQRSLDRKYCTLEFIGRIFFRPIAQFA